MNSFLYPRRIPAERGLIGPETIRTMQPKGDNSCQGATVLEFWGCTPNVGKVQFCHPCLREYIRTNCHHKNAHFYFFQFCLFGCTLFGEIYWNWPSKFYSGNSGSPFWILFRISAPPLFFRRGNVRKWKQNSKSVNAP